MVSYDDAILLAWDICDDMTNTEFIRGVTNILAELYPSLEMGTSERMLQVEDDIRKCTGYWSV